MMMNNKIDLIELKHNIDMLRIQFKGLKAASDSHHDNEHLYGQGIKFGLNMANEGYVKYIARLEKIIEGVNIYE